MIPYFQIPTFQFLGMTFHAFEVLTSLGIYLGIQQTLKMSRTRSIAEKNMIDLILLSIISGFIGAHVVHIVLYERNAVTYSKVFEVWKGISSTGGFLTGGFVAWVYVRRKKLPLRDVGDSMIKGLLVALFFGRIGCFTAHDHPGALTSVPWGVQFLGGVRHDLGLEEAVFIGIFFMVTHIPAINRFLDQKSGRWMISGILFYGIMRFALDFLRSSDQIASDPRYFGLTPAQYFCLFFVGLGIFWFKESPTQNDRMSK